MCWHVWNAVGLLIDSRGNISGWVCDSHLIWSMCGWIECYI